MRTLRRSALAAGSLLSLRSLAGLGRLLALRRGEDAPDAVDLPSPQREHETRGPDRAARRSLSPRPPTPATCPSTRSGRTDRDRRTGRRQAATTCRRQSAAPPRRGRGQPGGCLVAALRARLGPAGTTADSKERAWAALRAALHKHLGEAMANAGRNQHIHGCPRRIGSAALRWRESP
jgi:hypothetical protein